MHDFCIIFWHIEYHHSSHVYDEKLLFFSKNLIKMTCSIFDLNRHQSSPNKHGPLYCQTIDQYTDVTKDRANVTSRLHTTGKKKKTWEHPLSTIVAFDVNRPLTNDKQADGQLSAHSSALPSRLGSSSYKMRFLASRKTPRVQTVYHARVDRFIWKRTTLLRERRRRDRNRWWGFVYLSK